jgi:enolase
VWVMKEASLLACISAEEAMELLDYAVEKAGYKAGLDIAISLDPAASELYETAPYVSQVGRREQEFRRNDRVLG